MWMRQSKCCSTSWEFWEALQGVQAINCRSWSVLGQATIPRVHELLPGYQLLLSSSFWKKALISPNLSLAYSVLWYTDTCRYTETWKEKKGKRGGKGREKKGKKNNQPQCNSCTCNVGSGRINPKSLVTRKQCKISQICRIHITFSCKFSLQIVPRLYTYFRQSL